MRPHGQFGHTSFGIGHARAGQRTRRTVGQTRRALQGAKVHDGLIVCRRTLLVEQLSGQVGKQPLPLRRVGRLADARPAGQHPIDVAVDHRTRQPVCKRANGRRRVVANARQGTHAFVGLGKRSAPAHDGACRRMKMARAGVIAQPLPHPHHLVLGCLGQSLHRGKTLHETQEIVIPLSHARLLQYHFRNPYPIRIVRISPRQIAPVLFIPRLYHVGKTFHIQQSKIIVRVQI